MPKSSDPITEQQLSRWKLLSRFIGLLDKHGSQITEGKICERAAMRRMLTAGEFYLGDRNYGADFGLFDELDALGCGYVLRLQNEVKWEVIESHPLSREAVARGVTLDATVRLGHRGAGGTDRPQT